MVGKKFGRLTVIAKSDNGKWECLCDCGNSKLLVRSKLTTLHTKSCGCLKMEKLAEGNKIHGMSSTKLYGVYQGIMSVPRYNEQVLPHS